MSASAANAAGPVTPGRGWSVSGYTEVRRLGGGGFGEVVLAVHDASGTAVAIKYLHPGLLGDPGQVASFRAEASVLASLDSPYVVRLYQYVEDQAGAAIVMELVEGVTVAALLERNGKTTPESALVVLHGSLLGLAAAHAKGVVHRDTPGQRARRRGRREQADRLRHRRAGRRPAGGGGHAALHAARAVRGRHGQPGR